MKAEVEETGIFANSCLNFPIKGGFLASSWCDHCSTKELTRLIFPSLFENKSPGGATAFTPPWRPASEKTLATVVSTPSPFPLDPSEAPCVSQLINKTTQFRGKDGRGAPKWVEGALSRPEILGTPENTAQVHFLSVHNQLVLLQGSSKASYQSLDGGF